MYVLIQVNNIQKHDRKMNSYMIRKSQNSQKKKIIVIIIIKTIELFQLYIEFFLIK